MENNDPISFIDSMRNYDSITSQSQDIRQQLIGKLLPEVMKLDLTVDRTTDAEMFASKTKLINEMRGLLTDLDNGAKNHVMTKLKQQDSETQANISFSAADFLSKIKLTGSVPTSGTVVVENKDEIDKILEKQFEDSGCIVLDTELESGTLQLPSEEERKDEFSNE